ncbi:UDP-glycosyltransferase 73D1 [Dichanthelium oligosanthes]|uniref:UDP-glycosyltransferase 73D1 n=1 Tax=Dichanthelium oligosanthes TaxID=888268 RepID=A0A1E5VTF2_9POAL|nr:UDP-glycosyltransferase 73D1 [Dichanthelium oligosanthes]
MSWGGGADVAGAEASPHFVIVPMMAAGHAGPMLDMARVLAGQGALVTFVTTPLNLPRLGRAPGDDALPIRFLSLRFPCAEAGLPEGCESLDALPGLDLLGNFNDACAMLRAPLVAHLREDCSTPPASCIVSDACHPWTGGVARELGVPRLAFDGFCAFSSFCMRQMNFHRIFDGVDDDRRPVRVPGFPIDVEISRARSPGNFTGPGMKEFGEEIMAESARADGLVVNTFAELEPLFVDAYEAAIGRKIWTIGPLFLSTTMPSTATTEDANAARCASWLESKKPRSVVFVSFGSLVRSSLPQLVEIAHGLEASNRPFIWVVKPGNLAKFERWLSDDGFESRVGEKGLVIRDWAPQRAILPHPATGAFVTHCGWNSVLECVAAGLPMATWPHFAEQFMNEKLVVDMLRVGVPVGVKDTAQWGVETEAVVATREDVERAVAAVMDGGEEGSARRDRAAELGRKAREAVARGGSSSRNVKLLMEHVEQKKSMA